jgi:hypothetical protein
VRLAAPTHGHGYRGFPHVRPPVCIRPHLHGALCLVLAYAMECQHGSAPLQAPHTACCSTRTMCNAHSADVISLSASSFAFPVGQNVHACTATMRGCCVFGMPPTGPACVYVACLICSRAITCSNITGCMSGKRHGSFWLPCRPLDGALHEERTECARLHSLFALMWKGLRPLVLGPPYPLL